MDKYTEDTRIEGLRKSFLREPIVNVPVSFAFSLQTLAKGFAIVHMRVAHGMLVGGVGIVNGGVMDTLANTASVYAAMSILSEGHTPRMNFSATNLRRALRGEVLRAEARVDEDNCGSIVVRFQITNMELEVKVIGQAQYHKPKQ